MRSISEAQKLLNRMGTTVWKVMRILKPGGQGLTFEVVHTETNQKGVFKLIKTDNELSRQRFLREINFLSDSKYHHPNIVKILAHSSDSGNLWYISELGVSLGTHLGSNQGPKDFQSFAQPACFKVEFNLKLVCI